MMLFLHKTLLRGLVVFASRRDESVRLLLCIDLCGLELRLESLSCINTIVFLLRQPRLLFDKLLDDALSGLLLASTVYLHLLDSLVALRDRSGFLLGENQMVRLRLSVECGQLLLVVLLLLL